MVANLSRSWLVCLALIVTPPSFGEIHDTTTLSGIDTSVHAGDGFFSYANGRWLTASVIPSDHAEIGALQSAVDGMDERMRSLLDAASVAPKDENERKVGTYYQAFEDTQTRDRLGLSPLHALLHSIANAPDRKALASLMGREQIDFTGSLFDIYVDVDHRDGHTYSVFLTQAGLGLPDRANYLGAGFAPQREAYRTYLRYLLDAAGAPDPERTASEVLAFETSVARLSWDDDRQVASAEKRLDGAALARLAPGVDWSTLLDSAGVPPNTTVTVTEPGAVKALASLYARTPLSTLRAWMTVHAIDRAAPFLSTPMVAAWQRFHVQAVAGRTAPLPAWKLAVNGVAGMQCVGAGGPSADCFGSLRWAAGDLYLDAYFSHEVRDQAQTMIDALRSAFRQRLGSEPWMSATTRAEALRKLDAYTIKLGGPDQRADLSALPLRADDLVGDARAIAAMDWSAQLGRLNRRAAPTTWVEAPQTVDANNGEALDVEFPAGLFQPPVFDPHRDTAYNFGALGAFIGHEWTHGFDDQGRHIDADNRRRDWWTPTDDKAFRQRANTLASQYDAFQPLPGEHVHGHQTLDEDIADLGGLSVALDAYHASLRGKPAPVVDGFTGDQRVFLGWAWLWRGRKTEAALRQQLTDDGHAPYAVRVDAVVRNIDTWYDNFDVRPDQHLYLAPKNRVRLW